MRNPEPWYPISQILRSLFRGPRGEADLVLLELGLFGDPE